MRATHAISSISYYEFNKLIFAVFINKLLKKFAQFHKVPRSGQARLWRPSHFGNLFMLHIDVLPIFNIFQLIRSFHVGCDFRMEGKSLFNFRNIFAKVKPLKNACLDSTV